MDAGSYGAATVANVSLTDAQGFVDWLSEVAHKTFRLPSEPNGSTRPVGVLRLNLVGRAAAG
jgi:hypothetical protein